MTGQQIRADVDAASAQGCPPEMRDLWATAHMLLIRWDEHKEHPACPVYQDNVSKFMERLRAAAKRAEVVMDGAQP